MQYALTSEFPQVNYPVVLVIRIEPTPSGPMATSTRMAARWVLQECRRRKIPTRQLISSTPESAVTIAKQTNAGLTMVLVRDRVRHGKTMGTTVPWEQAAATIQTFASAGCGVVALGLDGFPTGLAACVNAGAIAACPVYRVDEVLDSLTVSRARQSPWRFHISQRPAMRTATKQFLRLTRLTPVELRVLYYMTEGLPAADIARSMHLALTTVRSHIRSILRKLEVTSQLAAVAVAHCSLGMLAPEEGGPR